MNTVSLVQLIISLRIIFPVNCTIDIEVTQNYFKEKNIKSAIVIGCFSKKEHTSLLKKFTFQTFPTSVLKIYSTRTHTALKTDHQHLGVVLDGDCSESQNFLTTCGQLKLFDVKHHWLIVSSSQSIAEKFEKVVLNIDADIHLALKTNTGQNWTIFDVYNPAYEHGGSLNSSKIGYYSEQDGYNAKIKEPKYWRRRNMTGITFNSMIVLVKPFEGSLENYLQTDNTNINIYIRFYHKMLTLCKNYYNFTLNIKVTKSWGYLLPNGSFDGIVGALQQKLIDFGHAPLFLREDRAKVIDYGRNVWIWRAGFIFRSPKTLSSVQNFLKPLSTSIWLITGIFAVISIVVWKVATTFEEKNYHGDVETSWSLSVIFTLGALCQQGSVSVPRMVSGRLTTISVFLLSMFIYQFYSASIVSDLLRKPTNKITSVKDILESPLKVGLEDYLYVRDFFTHTTDKVVRQLYNKKIYDERNTSHFIPAEQGLKYVKDGGFAFHVEYTTAYPIIEATFPDQTICELHEIQLIKMTDLCGSYQKGSPFYDMLETCFQNMAERGIFSRERRRSYRKPECIQASQKSNFHVSLKEFYPALLILLVGIASSLVVLFIEKRVNRLTTKKSDKKLKASY